MKDQPLCYVGCLVDRQHLESVLALLPERRQNDIRALLAIVSPLSDAEIRQRWSVLRAAEEADARCRLPAQIRNRFEDLPPILQRWVLTYGCADHQIG